MDENQIQIEGEWINGRTGERVIVRNSIIDGDNMILITNKGNISMADFSRNYVKAISDQSYDLNGNISNISNIGNIGNIGNINNGNSINDNNNISGQKTIKKSPSIEVINIDDFYMPDDDKPTNNINNNINNISKTSEEILSTTQSITQPSDDISINAQMIKKIFDKIDQKPEINIEILWNDFPKDQISTLVNFLDVSLDDITEYIYDNILSCENIKNKIKCSLENLMQSNKKSIIKTYEEE